MNVWTDGVVAGLTVSAVAAALVFDAILQATDGNAVAVAVNLAYPIGDTVLLALVVAAIGLSGWRVNRSWALAAAGCAVFAVTDSIYLYQVNAGTYDQFGLMNIGWPLGCLLLAYAAWQPARVAEAREEGWSGIGVSVACAPIAVGVLVYDHFHQVSAVTLGARLGRAARRPRAARTDVPRPPAPDRDEPHRRAHRPDHGPGEPARAARASRASASTGATNAASWCSSCSI